MTRARLLLFHAVVASCRAAVLPVELAHRRLALRGENPQILLQERHNFPPKARPIQKGEVVTSYSHLMTENMCRPQQNGYFGSTSGTPMIIEYGFELEMTIFANTGQVLDAINEYIETQVLSSAFPTICAGMGRRVLETTVIDEIKDSTNRHLGSFQGGIPQSSKGDQVTGFQFSQEVLEPSCKSDMRCRMQACIE
jgi:hypothetical protein